MDSTQRTTQRADRDDEGHLDGFLAHKPRRRALNSCDARDGARHGQSRVSTLKPHALIATSARRGPGGRSICGTLDVEDGRGS